MIIKTKACNCFVTLKAFAFVTLSAVEGHALCKSPSTALRVTKF
jgi:hypothetical protein